MSEVRNFHVAFPLNFRQFAENNQANDKPLECLQTEENKDLENEYMQFLPRKRSGRKSGTQKMSARVSGGKLFRDKFVKPN